MRWLIYWWRRRQAFRKGWQDGYRGRGYHSDQYPYPAHADQNLAYRLGYAYGDRQRRLA